MVRRTILMLALGMIVGLPVAAADDGATRDPVEAPLAGWPLPLEAMEAERAIPAIFPLDVGDECVGGWTGDDYVDFYDGYGGGVGVFVGAPIGPLALGIEVRNGVATISGDWVGVGVKALGNGCEADAILA